MPQALAPGGGKPPAPPPKALTTGANPRGVAVEGPAPKGTTLHDAVQQVFHGQNARGQAAVLKGVLGGKADPQTASAVRDAITKLPYTQRLQIQKYLPTRDQAGGGSFFDALGNFAENAGKEIVGSAGVGAGIGAGKASPKATGLDIPGVAAIKPMFATTGAAQLAPQIAKNAASDLWNYPGGTVEGLYGVGKDIYEGHLGNAFHALVDPYVNLAMNPVKTLEQHPVNTAMMLMGPKAAIGRGLGGLARAGVLGDRAEAFASTARAPLHLGTVAGEPSPITEARSYSPDMITEAMQKARESYLTKRGQNPNIARPAPAMVPKVMRNAFNIGVEAKLNRIGDEMPAVSLMGSRAERQQALDAVRKAAPPKEVRGVVGHILQGVIRSPQTAAEDMTNEINRLKAAQTGKRTIYEHWNKRQVRDLSIALKNPDKMPAAFKAAEALRPVIKAQDAYLIAHGLLDPEQAARRAVLSYAMTHMGAKYDPVHEHFTTANGDHLSTDEILAHSKANNVPDPAYVGHFPGKVSPARFYSAYKLARGTLGDKSFTGNAFRSGAYDHTFEGLAGQVASRAQAVARASLHDRVINRLGVSMPQEMRAQLIRKVFADAKAGKRTVESARNEAQLIRQGLFTRDEANHFARAAKVDDHGNPIPNSLDLTPISTAPAHVLGAVRDLQHPAELEHVSGIELQVLSHAIEDAQHSTARNVTLIPSVAARRFAEQYAKSDATMRGIGRVTQQFRRTVLPYSTHWMTQIGSEAGLRSMLAGTLDPRNIVDGHALMHRLQDSEEGRSNLMEMVNATFYNKRDPLAVHNPNPGVITSAAHTLPISKQLIWAHNTYANTVGSAMYTLEHNARLLGLGKLARQQSIEDFGHSWSDAVRLQGETLDKLATRLKSDPALVAKFGRKIDETFGKYNKFSPKVRAAVQSYAPFLPWYLNAAKYVAWTLPAHHPVASAMLASLRQTVNQDIADGKNAPLNAYAMQELARLSPFSILAPATSEPSLSGAFGGQQMLGAVFPQFQGSLYNFAGVNSYGQGPLKGPQGDVKAGSSAAIGAGIENAIEGVVPLASKARELLEGGKPAYGTSTFWNPQPEQGEPGVGVLDRMFNPFYGFERAKATASSPPFGKAAPSAASSAAANNNWSVVHSNPVGTSATNNTWTIASP
jgi:hypothetical protein